MTIRLGTWVDDVGAWRYEFLPSSQFVASVTLEVGGRRHDLLAVALDSGYTSMHLGSIEAGGYLVVYERTRRAYIFQPKKYGTLEPDYVREKLLMPGDSDEEARELAHAVARILGRTVAP